MRVLAVSLTAWLSGAMSMGPSIGLSRVLPIGLAGGLAGGRGWGLASSVTQVSLPRTFPEDLCCSAATTAEVDESAHDRTRRSRSGHFPTVELSDRVLASLYCVLRVFEQVLA